MSLVHKRALGFAATALGITALVIVASLWPHILSRSKQTAKVTDSTIHNGNSASITTTPTHFQPIKQPAAQPSPPTSPSRLATLLLSRVQQKSSHELVQQLLSQSTFAEIEELYSQLAAQRGSTAVDLRNTILTQLASTLPPDQAENALLRLAALEQPVLTGDDAITVAHHAGGLLADLNDVLSREKNPVPHLLDLLHSAHDPGSIMAAITPIIRRGSFDVSQREQLSEEMRDTYYDTSSGLVREQILGNASRWVDAAVVLDMAEDTFARFDSDPKIPVAAAIIALRRLSKRKPEMKDANLGELSSFARRQDLSYGLFLHIVNAFRELAPDRLGELEGCPIVQREPEAQALLDRALAGEPIRDPLHPPLLGQQP